MISFGEYFTPTGLKPEMGVAIHVIVASANRFHKDIVLSSGLDRKHSAKSLHYVGLAIDISWPHFDMSDARALRNVIASALGNLYDVVLESDHMHVEYQPKVAVNEHWRHV